MLSPSLVCIEVLFRASENLGKPLNKWHRAFASIYYSRVFLFRSLGKKYGNQAKLPHSRSCTVLDLEPRPAFTSVDQRALAELTRQKDLKVLCDLGGVRAIASVLQTDLENGVRGDDEDLAKRHAAFGTNTYKKPPSQGFLHFVWEAFKDFIILLLLFVLLSPLGSASSRRDLNKDGMMGVAYSLPSFWSSLSLL